ncbi:barstar family protein [Pantoea vagans]|uniref:barstar family protein n=1 Tax=Pantoea vagans TaxID=470934 RepID=UPI0010937ED1|nr:barstar family protein [Pantoea vagans]QCA04000.1 barnase inhibitor [Pantoea vagans]
MIIDGRDIHTESDVHRILAEIMEFGPYYGKNLDALWDCLSTDIERPIRITWCHSDLSKKRLGERFDKIIEVFERVRQQDIIFSWEDKFDYYLK